MTVSHFESVSISDVGRKRRNNEDRVLNTGDMGIFCAADGMGGVEGGEFASQVVVETIETVCRNACSNDATLTLDIKADHVAKALNMASRTVKGFADEKKYVGTGSTATAFVLHSIVKEQGIILHAGDSRAYRLRKGKLQLLTTDHSLAAAAGLKDDDSLPMRFRGVITRAVGLKTTVELDSIKVDIHPHDIFLLCTDGLTKMLPDKTIRRHLYDGRDSELESVAKALVADANEAGGGDNVSLVIIRIGDFKPDTARSISASTGPSLGEPEHATSAGTIASLAGEIVQARKTTETPTTPGHAKAPSFTGLEGDTMIGSTPSDHSGQTPSTAPGARADAGALISDDGTLPRVPHPHDSPTPGTGDPDLVDATMVESTGRTSTNQRLVTELKALDSSLVSPRRRRSMPKAAMVTIAAVVLAVGGIILTGILRFPANPPSKIGETNVLIAVSPIKVSPASASTSTSSPPQSLASAKPTPATQVVVAAVSPSKVIPASASTAIASPTQSLASAKPTPATQAVVAAVSPSTVILPPASASVQSETQQPLPHNKPPTSAPTQTIASVKTPPATQAVVVAVSANASGLPPNGAPTQSSATPTQTIVTAMAPPIVPNVASSTENRDAQKSGERESLLRPRVTNTTTTVNAIDVSGLKTLYEFVAMTDTYEKKSYDRITDEKEFIAAVLTAAGKISQEVPKKLYRVASSSQPDKESLKDQLGELVAPANKLAIKGNAVSMKEVRDFLTQVEEVSGALAVGIQ